MIQLGNIFKQYTGALRDLKLVYVLNNWLNANRLRHNKSLYKRYGIKRSIFSPIGSKDIPRHPEDIPWIDQPDALERVEARAGFKSFSNSWQQKIIQFIEEGYLILENFYDIRQVTQLNDEVEQLMSSGKLGENFTGRKIMNAHQLSDVIDNHFRQPDLLRLMSFLLGKEVLPFQTINFIRGSEQRAHSDSIHMTTEPQGYLAATWLALEKCHEGNGALFYYPKSHRLPFVSCEDYNAGHTAWMLGKKSYPNYEDFIAQLIQQHQLEKKVFHANAGDVLIWHSNLLHGGGAITKEGTSRKSMVAHYYTQEVVCYHELTQRPALIDV